MQVTFNIKSIMYYWYVETSIFQNLSTLKEFKIHQINYA